jgi:hypothetical protein
MLTKSLYTVDVKLLEIAVSQLPQIDYKKTINQPTGDFFYDSWIIKEEFKGTVWEELISALPLEIGEARIIALAYGNNYQSHADIDDRYNLNIQGNQSFLIDLDNKQMHQTVADGHWYEMDAGNIHSAANFGEVIRVQLVVRKLLTKNILRNPKQVKIICIDENLARYNFDNSISSWLNKNNKKGLITDFVFKETVVEFKVEEAIIQDLENLVPKQFKLEIN